MVDCVYTYLEPPVLLGRGMSFTNIDVGTTMTDSLIATPDTLHAEASKPTSTVVSQVHPIAEAITRFLHHARDIKWSCRIFAPVAAEIMKQRFDKSVAQIKSGESLLQSEEAVKRVHGAKELQEAVRKLERIKYSKIPEVIETSLFLSLFSAFDAYTGELLSAIYERKPELFSKLTRQIDLVDVLTANSIEALKQSVLEDEIESFRRKSYIEQFAELEATFGLPLKKFERWSAFVECTQRRNLLTHCGGVVSEQYRKICKNEGCAEKDIPPLGTKLGLGPEYFLPTCELLIEVGLKLGQTLWRKVLPDELSEADKHLHRTQYDALYSHNWSRAKVFGEFGVTQHKRSSEIERRLGIINYCIALKFSGDEAFAQTELKKVDWSASINDFRLAEAVLQDRFNDAASLMLRIGESGEMVTKEAYHTWPLFHQFRESVEFCTAYEQIYKHPFVAELQRTADATLTDASAKEDATVEYLPEHTEIAQ